MKNISSFVFSFFQCTGGNADIRKNSRALLESSQATSAATKRNKAQANIERELAASAASGAAVPRKFAPGEAKKNKRKLMHKIVWTICSEE